MLPRTHVVVYCELSRLERAGEHAALQKCMNCRSTMKLVGPIHLIAGSQAHGCPHGVEQLEPQDSSTDCAMVIMARDCTVLVLVCDAMRVCVCVCVAPWSKGFLS